MKAFLPRLLLAALLPLLLAGCVQLAEVDSTADPKYQAIIGREYALREDFLACGVKREYPSPGFDYVVIMPPPGLGGRYIVDLGRIPAGSRFRITGVITRRSKLFPDTEYVVSFLDPIPVDSAGKPIRLNSTTPAWDLYAKPAGPDAPPELNELRFRPLGESTR